MCHSERSEESRPRFFAALRMTGSVSVMSCQQTMQHLDISIFKLINSGLASPVLDPVMLAVTALGTGVAQTALSLVILLAGWYRGSVDMRRAGYAGLIACAAAGIASQLAKIMWNRPRPLLAIFDVRVVGDPLFVNSFPSGHATTAFAVAVAVSVLVPRLRLVLIPVAALIGLSRIYVGAHFPLDVAYGALMGTLVGLWSAGILRSHQPVPLTKGDHRGLPEPEPPPAPPS